MHVIEPQHTFLNKASELNYSSCLYFKYYKVNATHKGNIAEGKMYSNNVIKQHLLKLQDKYFEKEHIRIKRMIQNYYSFLKVAGIF